MHNKAVRIKAVIILVVLFAVLGTITVYAISSSDINIAVPYYGYFFQSENTDPVY